jgi:hypothetical protein
MAVRRGALFRVLAKMAYGEMERDENGHMRMRAADAVRAAFWLFGDALAGATAKKK